MIEPDWLNLRDVCAIHSEILAESGGDSGIIDRGALESTLNQPKQLYYDNDRASMYELAAAYGYGLVKNHCFGDGNRRIALIAVYTFLAVDGVELTASEVDAASFFLNLAASTEPQAEGMAKLAAWLEDRSQ